MTVADRIAVMDHGKVVQVATPAEIYEQPNSRWVAEFVGDVNLIEGGIVSTGADATVIAGAGGRRFRAAPMSEAKPGARVWLALRPEKVRIATTPPAENRENCLSGRVWDIGYLGDVSIYKVRLDDGNLMKASVANATRLSERPIGWDGHVWLSWTHEAGVVLAR